VRETFPDRLLDQADEVVLTDLPTDALRERIAQGRVYPPERVRPALTNFFRLDNLIALRALALREVAERRVDVHIIADRRRRSDDPHR
jgi:two-component system sensor histidine kinase KdpD